MTGSYEQERDELLKYQAKHGWLDLYDYLFGWDRNELVESIFCLLNYYPDGVDDD
jgi:hypothetical protein